jgi:DNA-binding transcriptional MerR regulator
MSRVTRIFRVSELARELGCSEGFIREAEKQGRLPKAKRDLNGWRFYNEEDLEKLREIVMPSAEQQLN